MSILQTIETDIGMGAQKTEAWVVSELAKGWAALKALEAEGAQVLQTAAVDVENVFAWVKSHQSGLLSLLQEALTGVAALGVLAPQAAPAVAGATTAIDAATAAIDALSAATVTGSTPLSTLTNAYQAGNDAATAVKTALKAISTPGSVVPHGQAKKAAAPAAPAAS